MEGPFLLEGPRALTQIANMVDLATLLLRILIQVNEKVSKLDWYCTFEEIHCWTGTTGKQ